VDSRLTVSPYEFAAVQRLRRALGCSHVLAQVLVRRGLGEPGAARAFLAAAESHPLEAFPGLADAAARVLAHIERRSRITVHGDYDVDGICATAVLVRALRTLGADVDWYLPSRIDDGYGLARPTVERLAARGTQLLVTVDCAITAVEEVAAARAAGLDVIVTDHHSPRADGALPDAPIVHPGLAGYPCPELCAAGVAYKLAQALLAGAGEDPALADEDLDLVALATVADVVPLRGENRRLVRAGLRALAGTRKVGLRALMDVARVDPGLLDESAIGFRLGPRLNAAGRLYRADAGLELLLTEDRERARAVAAELDAVNSERRDVETAIRFEAEALAAEYAGAPAFVLAAEGWHPGVIGIVAARIAERHHRPAVLIALEGEEGTGSGRSIPAFDLLGGLHAGAAHLERYGGHRAAAGLSIRREDVDAFRAALVEHAAAVLRPEDLVPEVRIDAVVQGDALSLSLAEELERLAPFGMGNPSVSLLVPAATLSDPRPLGEGRHVAFTLNAGGARSRCVAFGRGGELPCEPGAPADAAVRLEIDRWNGAVSPRLVLRHAQPVRARPIEVLGEPDLAAGVRRELERDLLYWSLAGGRGDLAEEFAPFAGGAAREPQMPAGAPRAFAGGDRPAPAGGDRLASAGGDRPAPAGGDRLASAGGDRLAATSRDRAAAAGARPFAGAYPPGAEAVGPDAPPALAGVPKATSRSAFAAGPDVADLFPATGDREVRDLRGTGIAGLLGDLVASGEPVLAVTAHAPHRARTLQGRVGGFAVTSWAALEDDPRLAAAFPHVVAIDPPSRPPFDHPSGRGWTHLAWGEPELEFARHIHEWDFALRDPLIVLYRALRALGTVRGEACESVLRGEGPQPRSPALAGRLARILLELGLASLESEGLGLTVAESPQRTALERSAAYRAYQRRLEDGRRYLTSSDTTEAAA
jgi:single-stranded-DNA-specific exonuclease RecJ